MSLDPLRIGIVGAGNIGHALAVRFAAAGHEVVLSNSRGPNTLAGVVASIEGNVGVGTVAEAARFGDVVAVALMTSGRLRAGAPKLGSCSHPAVGGSTTRTAPTDHTMVARPAAPRLVPRHGARASSYERGIGATQRAFTSKSEVMVMEGLP